MKKINWLFLLKRFLRFLVFSNTQHYFIVLHEIVEDNIFFCKFYYLSFYCWTQLWKLFMFFVIFSYCYKKLKYTIDTIWDSILKKENTLIIS